MPKLKLDSKLGRHVLAAIDDLTEELYAQPGTRIVAVVELGVSSTTSPGGVAEIEEEGTVKLRLTCVEVFRGDDKDTGRQVMLALYNKRTSGPLDDGSADDLTLKHAVGLVSTD